MFVASLFHGVTIFLHTKAASILGRNPIVVMFVACLLHTAALFLHTSESILGRNPIVVMFVVCALHTATLFLHTSVSILEKSHIIVMFAASLLYREAIFLYTSASILGRSHIVVTFVASLLHMKAIFLDTSASIWVRDDDVDVNEAAVCCSAQRWMAAFPFHLRFLTLEICMAHKCVYPTVIPVNYICVCCICNIFRHQFWPSCIACYSYKKRNLTIHCMYRANTL